MARSLEFSNAGTDHKIQPILHLNVLGFISSIVPPLTKDPRTFTGSIGLYPYLLTSKLVSPILLSVVDL